MRILIIGGGIVGLSVGWQLARQQMEVHLFEKSETGKEASWTAAGMLSPYSEIEFSENNPHVELGLMSLASYPQFLQELNEDAKTNLSFESSGTLYVGIDRDDRTFLERLFHSMQRKNAKVTWLSPKEAREKEPLLSPRVSSAIWIEEETHINNRNVLAALKTAFKSRGGILHEHCPVKDLWIQDESLQGIWTDKEIAGNCVINCAGAWANGFYESPIPIYPNKGQILTLLMSEKMTLNCMVRTPRIYLVPKSDRSLRIGATSEEMGFDRTVTGGGVLGLLQAAYEVIPEIAYMSFQAAEANLRPASFDRHPQIEETALKGYFQASGHGRAGILLAPYTAYEIVRKLCKSK